MQQIQILNKMYVPNLLMLYNKPQYSCFQLQLFQISQLTDISQPL